MRAVIALLAVCTVCGCTGTITSDAPLLDAKNASFPLPRHAQLEASTLHDDVWQRDARKGRIDLVDGAYRVTGLDEPAPSPESYLFRQVGRDEFVAQARNEYAWAYGLIVREDRYYLFTFNRPDENCTSLSAAEQNDLHVTVRNDQCLVANLHDLTGLLRRLRQMFPHPTSAFTVKAPGQ
jgi:hypothetical protein